MEPGYEEMKDRGILFAHVADDILSHQFDPQLAEIAVPAMQSLLLTFKQLKEVC